MPTANVSKWAAGIVLAILTAVQGVALAAGLQISPISITIPADKRADEVWLRNTSTEVVHAQVRVYHWSQAEGEDVLVPDQHMVASPPMVQLQPGQQQLVRLVRVGPLSAPAVNERTYRVLIDELPIQRTAAKAGLDFVFRYSVPVFIAGTAPAQPQLDWSVQEADGQAWLRVANSGTSRAQLANIEYTPHGGQTVMAMNGLAGYVLAGQYRSLPLGLPASLFTKGGVFSSLINAVQAETRVAPIIKSP